MLKGKGLGAAAAVALMALGLAGCGVATAIQSGDLYVENKMSRTIFLEPVGPEQRTVFIEVRNTSDQPEFTVSDAVRQAIAARGYTVVEDPDRAQYLLQANVLQVGKVHQEMADDILEAGVGGGLIGGAAGAGIGALAGQGDEAILGGLLAGAALGALSDLAFEDVTYAATTDIRISERRKNADLTPSNPWDRHETRIQSRANQVNLDLEDALPELRAGIANSIAGLF